MNTNPYIFILDLDNTIIGDCLYQCELYNIINILKSKKIKTKELEEALSKAYRKKSKLIRPFFAYFINKIRSKFPNASIFVYTASEKKWALKEIEYIEKNLNITFDKPIFTRDDCIIGSDGNLKKSIKKIIPKIKSTLQKKKKQLNTNKILVIDNYNSYVDYTDNVFVCPSYNYIQFDNLWDRLPKNYTKIKELKNNIRRLIMKEIISPYSPLLNEYNIKKLRTIYKWFYIKTNMILKYNSHYEKDVFWKKLTLYLIKNNINNFDLKTIKNIRSVVK